MPKTTLMNLCIIFVSILVITSHAYPQTADQLTNTNSSLANMFIHGYTGYRDLEHCFVRDGATKRSLYFRVYTLTDITDAKQIDLHLFTYENGHPVEVEMTRGDKNSGQWWVKKYSKNMFTIEIKKDAPPHLGPGPYDAIISTNVSPSASDGRTEGHYPYATWREDHSPLDCLTSSSIGPPMPNSGKP